MSNTALGFGRDISCTNTLRTGRFSTGARLIGEALFRRFTTKLGSLAGIGGEDEADYGFDLLELVGSTQTADDSASLPSKISSEASKDERILDASTQVIATTNNGLTTWTITIQAQTAAGPFKLVLAVSAVTIELLSLSTGGDSA